MDIQAFRDLRTPAGQQALEAAARSDVTENALLATASRLREEYPAELVSAALTQIRLRARARAKFGTDAAAMYFTQAGLEQSTRASVAAHRARRFAAYLGASGNGAGPSLDVHRVLELGCGIGADLIARARAGCQGEGVELDPLTAEVARANVAAFGLEDLASVRVGDATGEDPRGYAALFADPGRRTARGRVFDPRSYEPPLDTVLAMARSVPAACVKVAPGIPYEALWDAPGPEHGVPASAGGPLEAEWISVGGEVKEAALWLGGLAGDAARRATLIPSGPGEVRTLTPEPGLGDPPVGDWGRFLYEPDGAVIRAHLVAEVAARVGGRLADPRIAYITSDALEPTPFAAAYEIEDVLPFSVKRLRGELRRRGVGTLTIKKRGSAVDPERLRHDLGFGRRASGRAAGGGAAALTLVLTRVGRAPVALLTTPAR
ncbi:THUMP-like domain-containing protein [Actinomadura viridis]|uniref:SAM-dependent methyltransferase n=1 Tax=Actinomadura viridis TaxID=58110 RepID=A0A931DCS8_9ACTN|nr:SAM-dependent methyltransferase [Actinomadura viridis]MBG6086484.1 SAM-dependent methyltransferase [Actinomadura viridis]